MLHRSYFYELKPKIQLLLIWSGNFLESAPGEAKRVKDRLSCKAAIAENINCNAGDHRLER